MNQQIKITPRTISQHPVLTVNARELHTFLESKQDFSNWINNRIQQYGFVLDNDYLVNKIIEQVPHQGGMRNHTKNEYFITLNMAKELAMVERTTKGRQARQYFISCEEQLHAYHTQQRHTQTGQSIKNANWHLTQLIHTLKETVRNQQKTMEKIVSLHEQSLHLQSISLELLQRHQHHTSKKTYRQATSDDIDPVHHLLEQGHTYNQISQQIGISHYAINRIKHHQYTHDEHGGRLKYYR